MTTVLVVDDEPQLLRALGINLRARKYDVYTAATGTEALLVAAAHPPDIVILDLGLPDMDGTEVIAGLRAGPPYRSSYCPAEPTRPTKSMPSTPALTTTSPSPSRWTSSLPASAS